MSAFNQSNGVNIKGNNVQIKGDVIGRDKTSPEWFLLARETDEISIYGDTLIFGGGKLQVIAKYCEYMGLDDLDKLKISKEANTKGIYAGRLDNIQIGIGEVKDGRITF